MGKFKEACEKYTQCLALDSTSAKATVYYTNRAFANLKQENFMLVINDSNAALKIQPNFAKAFYRRAGAYCALNKWNDAVKDFYAAHQLSPEDVDAKQKYDWALKEKRYRAFGSTLDYGVSIDKILEDNIVIEPSYQGPILNDLKEITLEWVIKIMNYFKDEQKLHKKCVIKMVKALVKYYKAQPTLKEINLPEGAHITVCGDVHGQFYDLLNIFKLNGNPSPTNPYLFNGDFVDRGSFSVEVLLTLMSWNLLYPDSFFLNRGNHESTQLNMLYGFNGEVKSKYDSDMYSLFKEFFFALPLCYLLNKKIFVVHGGIPANDGVTLDEIKKVARFSEPGEKGLMSDLLWSDFVNEDGRHLSKRGVSYAAGPDVAAKFVENNGLKMIVRSHEMKEEGYEVQRGGKVVTVFSAPNYCDQGANKGAFIRFTAPDMNPVYTQFTAVVILQLYANPLPIATSKQASHGLCFALHDVLINFTIRQLYLFSFLNECLY